MTYRVNIDDCMPQFRCAYYALIDSLGGVHHIIRTSQQGENQLQMLEHNWKLKFNAELVAVNGNWRYLDFDSEQHYTVFILKWS